MSQETAKLVKIDIQVQNATDDINEEEELVEYGPLTYNDTFYETKKKCWTILKDLDMYPNEKTARTHINYMAYGICPSSRYSFKCTACNDKITFDNISIDFCCIKSTYYCKVCVKLYVKSKLRYGKKIAEVDYYNDRVNCLCNDKRNYKCRVVKTSEVLTRNDYDKIMAKTQKISLNDIKLLYCPLPDCGGKIDEKQCEKCATKFCQKCSDLDHPGKECDKSTLDARLDALKLGGSDVNICNNCGNTMFKASGCSSVFCWNCSNFINWDTGNKNGSSSGFEGKNYYEVYRDSLAKLKKEKKTSDANELDKYIKRFDG